MNRLATGMLLLTAALLTGCDEAPTAPADTAAAKTSPKPVAAVPAAPVPVAPVAAQPNSTPANPAGSAPNTIVERADTGAGKKGRGYGGGVITEPIRQYFRINDSIAYNIQIPNGMKTFKAEKDRYPRDFAEFKREILEPANIVLPELPPGEKYVYDAREGELMVERPAPGQAGQ